MNRKLAVCLFLAAASVPSWSQSLVMSLPRDSQRAVVSQRVGLTDVTVTYHRPLVNGRKVWGGLVPYGQVWRAGANENTTIEFSDPVKVEGHALDKGIYGLHMIPTADSWTIVFSKNSTSWGSFTYKQDEDALRVTVQPHATEMHEAVTYDFYDVKDDSAAVTLQWEKLAVPFRVSVDNDVTLQNIRNQLRNSAQYTWMGWNDAAQYCLSKKTNLDEGLKWVGQSIQMEERFENLITKADLLKAMNRAGEAPALISRAMEIGNASQVYFYGRQLQNEKKKSEAIAIYRTVAKRFPQHWIGHVAQARVYVADGDFSKAVSEIKASLATGAPEAQKVNLENLIKRLENKEDINA